MLFAYRHIAFAITPLKMATTALLGTEPLLTSKTFFCPLKGASNTKIISAHITCTLFHTVLAYATIIVTVASSRLLPAIATKTPIASAATLKGALFLTLATGTSTTIFAYCPFQITAITLDATAIHALMDIITVVTRSVRAVLAFFDVHRTADLATKEVLASFTFEV